MTAEFRVSGMGSFRTWNSTELISMNYGFSLSNPMAITQKRSSLDKKNFESQRNEEALSSKAH